MPRTAKIHRKRPSPHDLGPSLSREERFQKAIDSWKQKESPSLLNAAKKHGIAHKYSTLHRRAHGLTQTFSDSRKKQRLLTDAQEHVLVEWIQFLGVIGRPVSKDTIRPFVYDLCGSYPSKNWTTRFNERNPAHPSNVLYHNESTQGPSQHMYVLAHDQQSYPSSSSGPFLPDGHSASRAQPAIFPEQSFTFTQSHYSHGQEYFRY